MTRSGARARQSLATIVASLPDDVPRFVAEMDAADKPALLAEAGRHGLRGVILHHAKAAGLAVSGADALTAADEAVQQRQRENLAEVVRALRGGDVRCVCLKGPLLGERLYPTPLLRPSTDLDVLVAPQDLARAVQALGVIGYVAADGGASERFYRDHHHHVHLHRDGGAPIELHHRAHSGFGAGLPADELLARAIPWADAHVLSPEDEWLYLAVHAASHVFERLGWVYDLKLLTHRRPALAWSAVVDRARQHGVLGAVSFTRDLLASRFRQPIPATGFRTTPYGAWRLYARAQDQDAWGRGASFALRLLLCDDASAAVRLASRKVRGRIATRSVDA